MVLVSAASARYEPIRRGNTLPNGIDFLVPHDGLSVVLALSEHFFSVGTLYRHFGQVNKSLGATTEFWASPRHSRRCEAKYEHFSKTSIGTQRGWKRLLLSYIGSDVPRAIRGLRRRHKLQQPAVNIEPSYSAHPQQAPLLGNSFSCASPAASRSPPDPKEKPCSEPRSRRVFEKALALRLRNQKRGDEEIEGRWQTRGRGRHFNTTLLKASFGTEDVKVGIVE